MRCKWNLTIASLCLLGTWIAPSFASDITEKGRDVFNKARLAVVTIEVVVKASGPGGRSGESKQDITGTVVDPSGLTVVALSACDPAEMYRRVSQEYNPDATMSATSLGCPAFLPDGRILGVFVIRAVSSEGEGTSNYRQNLTSIILPAEDILKGAKQAPDVKPDSEKKEEPKDSKEKSDGADKK